MTAPVVYVIHEYPEWLVPLRAAFEAEGVPWVDWFVHEGRVDLDAGDAPQAVVPAGAWFGAEVVEAGPGAADFALVGCTVAPGFDFADFELASDMAFALGVYLVVAGATLISRILGYIRDVVVAFTIGAATVPP